MANCSRHNDRELADFCVREALAIVGEDGIEQFSLGALFLWSVMHGLAGILRISVPPTLEIPPELRKTKTPVQAQRKGRPP